MIVKKKLAGVALCLAASLLMPTAWAKNTVVQTPIADQGQAVPRAQDDFYLYVNQRWMQQVKIPAEESQKSTIQEAKNQVRKNLREVTLQAVKNRKQGTATPDEARIADLYACIQDTKGRTAAGLGQLAAGLQAVEQVQDLQAYAELMGRFNALYPAAAQDYRRLNDQHGAMVGSIWIGNHPIDNDRYVAFLEGPSTGLGKEFMEDESNAAYFKVYRTYIRDLLIAYGRSKEQAEQSAAAIFALEQDLARHAMPMADRMDPSKSTHQLDLAELQALCPHVPVQAMLDAAGVGPAQGIDSWYMTDPALLQYFDTLYTPERLPILKDYAIFMLLSNYSDVLSPAYQSIHDRYTMEMSGATQLKTLERRNMELNESLLVQNYGRVYVKRYFTEQSKAEVTSYVKMIRDAYKAKLSKLDWMSPDTKRAALQKLDALDIYVAEPGVWPKYIDAYTFVRPEKGGTLIDNVLQMNRVMNKVEMERLGKPVIKGLWEGFSSQTVNAFYTPMSNSINFPTGMLMAPFFDPKRDRETNFGGIGSIIGHEITHSFDSGGAQYDAQGRLRNWWTPQDYAAFKERQGKVIAFYSSYAMANGTKMNGAATLTENIADLGSISCLSGIIGQDKAGLRRMYQNYGITWRMVLRDGMLKQYLVDVHALPYMRVNAVLSSTQGFYDAFDVKPGDGMYVAPEDRAVIW